MYDRTRLKHGPHYRIVTAPAFTEDLTGSPAFLPWPGIHTPHIGHLPVMGMLKRYYRPLLRYPLLNVVDSARMRTYEIFSFGTYQPQTVPVNRSNTRVWFISVQ